MLALTYYRLLNRLTANEITEKTGVNFYLLESGKRPVSIATIIKLESVFGDEAVSNLLNHTWHGEGEWNEASLKKRIQKEQEAWEMEKRAKDKR
jgi:hypothetical protein